MNLNPKNQARRRFVIYNTITSMTTLIKHLNFFGEEVNNLFREDEQQC